jgi:hypothetical protein
VNKVKPPIDVDTPKPACMDYETHGWPVSLAGQQIFFTIPIRNCGDLMAAPLFDAGRRRLASSHNAVRQLILWYSPDGDGKKYQLNE